jgi:cell division protein DivIC
MKLLNNIPSFFFNKFLLTALGFVAWMLFFDNDNFFTQAERRRELGEKQEGIRYFQEKIKEDRRFSSDITSDPAILEKYAREKYKMKRDNEDLFLIQKPEKE